MQAQHIQNDKLAHQCARCMRSYETMFRHDDDGLVYCSRNGACREIPKGAKISVQPTQRSTPKERPAPKARAKKSTAKRPVKKAAARRTRVRT